MTHKPKPLTEEELALEADIAASALDLRDRTWAEHYDRVWRLVAEVRRLRALIRSVVKEIHSAGTSEGLGDPYSDEQCLFCEFWRPRDDKGPVVTTNIGHASDCPWPALLEEVERGRESNLTAHPRPWPGPVACPTCKRPMTVSLVDHYGDQTKILHEDWSPPCIVAGGFGFGDSNGVVTFDAVIYPEFSDLVSARAWARALSRRPIHLGYVHGAGGQRKIGEWATPVGALATVLEEGSGR